MRDLVHINSHKSSFFFVCVTCHIYPIQQFFLLEHWRNGDLLIVVHSIQQDLFRYFTENNFELGSLVTLRFHKCDLQPPPEFMCFHQDTLSPL